MVRWACESLGATQMASEPRNVSLTRRLLEYSKSRNISWEFLRKLSDWFNYLTAPHKRRKIRSTYGDGTVHDSGLCSHGDNFTNARDAEQMRLCSRSVRSLHLKKNKCRYSVLPKILLSVNESKIYFKTKKQIHIMLSIFVIFLININTHS